MKMNEVMQQSHLAADCEKIVNIYSDEDREHFSARLHEALMGSRLVKILDENAALSSGNLRDVLQVCFNLGKIDASLAWVVGVSNAAWSVHSSFHSHQFLSEMAARNNILAMVLGRPGRLRQVSTNQYVLNGEWRYASGWRYANYFFCLAAMDNQDKPAIQIVAVPAQQLEVSADWQATGLRATQSVTVRAHDIKITIEQMEDYSRILKGENISPTHDGEHIASYAGLFTGVLMNCLLGSMLGATEAGLEYVIAAASKMSVVGSSYALMSDSGAIRAEVGRLRSSLDLYKRAAEYNADIIDKAALEPSNKLTVQERVDNRARATVVMRGCVEIVQDLLWIYGASALDKGHPLERIWRDVNVGSRHGGFSKLVPEEAAGLAALGQDPTQLTYMF